MEKALSRAPSRNGREGVMKALVDSQVGREHSTFEIESLMPRSLTMCGTVKSGTSFKVTTQLLEIFGSWPPCLGEDARVSHDANDVAPASELVSEEG